MRGEKGFTMLEMMFSIIIMAILAAVAVPNIISWRANSAFSGDARALKADIEKARSIAIKDHTNVTVAFTPNSRSYTIDGATHTLTGTSITGTNPATGQVIFDSRGRADNSLDVTLSNGSRNATISIGIIGSVRIQ